MLIAIIAALCMLTQDSLAIFKYQAAARNNGVVAALSDLVIWCLSITSTTIAAFTLHGNNTMQKVLVVGLVSCANVCGNLLGTTLGKKFIKDEDKIRISKELQDLHERILHLESDRIN